jgi:UDP-2,4-diacetamido-2,4,6-trideoxy-beta-L-altropyranose hydrolase
VTDIHPALEAPLCLIRADASPTIGGGHVMRCLTLASQLRALGWRILLVTTAETRATLSGLIPDWVDMTLLDPGDRIVGSALIAAVPAGCDLLVVDGYDFDADYARELRPWARRICCIDDLANRSHDCDLLIDQTLGRAAADYVRRVPPRCEILTGPAYALLRQEFAGARFNSMRAAQRAPSEGPRRVLVSMGLGDAGGLTPLVLDGIAASGIETEVRVVIGRASPSLAAVHLRASRNPAICVIENAGGLAEHILWADLGIGTAGTTAWERCVLGLPTLLITVSDDLNDNQAGVAAALSRAGAAFMLGRARDQSVESVAQAFRNWATNAAALHAMSSAATALCDGLGAARVAMHLERVLNRSGEVVTLRPVTTADAELLFTWQREPGAREFSRNPAVPAWEEHVRWLTRRLAARDAITEVICCAGEPAGVIRLDRLDGHEWEVSILVGANRRGSGVGPAALGLLRRLMPTGAFKAHVQGANTASAAAFERAGYHRRDGWFISQPRS